jgi:positive regulator of sigma E activity
MKNAVFWDVTPCGSCKNRRLGGTYRLRHQGEKKHVRFEVFTAVIMKNGVFWVVTPCGSCKNRRFGGTWPLLHLGDKNR